MRKLFEWRRDNWWQCAILYTYLMAMAANRKFHE